MQTYDLKEKEYLALQEAIADALESAQFGVSVGEVLVLKSVGTLRRQILGLKKGHYIVAKISLDGLSGKERNALQGLGWSHYFVLQDILALGSLASLIGLVEGTFRLDSWRICSRISGYGGRTDATLEVLGITFSVF